jgi:tetratricopeptide (TPR) repeat protein
MQACEMFPEQNNSLIYAHLCNSAFVIHYDLNDLRSCEKALKTSLEIRKKLLPADDLELATAYGNCATLLATQGNHAEALNYFELSQSSRNHDNEEHRLANAVFESSFGWALRRKGEYDLARKKYQKAERVYSDFSDVDILTALLV